MKQLGFLQKNGRIEARAVAGPEIGKRRELEVKTLLGIEVGNKIFRLFVH